VGYYLPGMPLTNEDRIRLRDVFDNITGPDRTYLHTTEILRLFDDLGIGYDMQRDMRELLMAGISHHGQVEITFTICETFYVAWQDPDKLGILKTCFRGMILPDGDEKEKINLEQFLHLASMLNVGKDRDDLEAALKGKTQMSFAETAFAFYGYFISADASAHDVFQECGTCLLL
jgi:hypothetical protein